MTQHDSSAPLVRLNDVAMTFTTSRGVLPVLRGLDLTVREGEVVAILGGSGCGKSTLLRIIAGLETRHTGSVIVGGRAVKGPDPARGMAFQEHRLFPWLTVAENVEFGLRALPRGERHRASREQIALVGLAGFEAAYPEHLSGGMAQRAALARALAPKPRVLLLDEPFAALDGFTKTRLQEELLRIRAVQGLTVVLVTHDVEEAVFLGDRVGVMSDRPGSICHLVAVDLAHPRDRTGDAFVRVRRKIVEGWAPSA